MPEVSVIIPTFNRQKLVEKAIFSVLDQIYNDFELIVVDDASVDNTCQMVSKIKDNRLQYIRHRIQKGASTARNTGIEASSGKYLAFLDDDDQWLPEKLQLQMNAFNKNSNLGLVYSGYYYVDAKSGNIFKEFRPSKKGLLDDRLLKENCVGTTSTAVIKRECIDKVGGFDINLRGCQDWDLWIRISKEYPIDYVARPLVKFLDHDVRITHNIDAKIQGKQRLLNKIFPEIKNKPKILSEHIFIIGLLYCTNGNIKMGRKKIFEALKLNPIKIHYYKYFIPSLFGQSFYTFMSSNKIIKKIFNMKKCVKSGKALHR